MQYRLLSSGGEVRLVDDEWVNAAITIALQTELETGDNYALEKLVSSEQVLLIEFQSVADGRGFSSAAELRENDGYKGLLYACGRLNPDQLTLAFQCGFDGMVVDEQGWVSYGEAAWQQALKPVVDSGYAQTRWNAIDSIWMLRGAAVR